MTRRFLKRLLIFLLLLIGVNAALDQLYKRFVVHNILNRAVDKQFSEYNDTLKWLAMGNSHNCVNTHIMGQTFNYSAPGETYIQTYYKLKYILEETGKTPENLILFIDISSFGPNIANRMEYNSYWIKYVDYFELSRIKKNRAVLSKWVEGKFFSYAGNYKDIELSLVYLIKIRHLKLYRGYRPHRNYKNFANEKDKIKKAKFKANLYLSRDAYYDDLMKVYFEMILDLCQKHDVKVILIRIPVTKEYYEEVSGLVPVDLLYKEVEESYAPFPNVSMVLDWHDLYFDHPEYFFDPDHLNPEGSDLFTTKLRETLSGSCGP